MKIVLINPPFMNVYGGFKTAARIGAAYPPTGLLYIASSAIAAGHAVTLIDMDVEGLSLEQMLDKVKAIKPDINALTATTPIYSNAKTLMVALEKNSPAPTVLGGIHLTIMLEKVLEDIPALDFGVYGEGEITFVELLNILKKINV
jgi:anaerobic magnesium-protoporphyrin IX monomethyl ester cyclase